MVKHLLTGLMVCGLLLAGCSAIDEDLDNCGKEYVLRYDLRLLTNMTTELETVLSEDADQPVAEALRDYLRPIFTDYAHDVDLAFYNVTADSALSHHEEHIMDAHQTSYTIYLPVSQYMHLALANIADARNVSYSVPERSSDAELVQQKTDTVLPHNTGLFTARLPMDVQEGIDQTFFVHLYMVNSALALVVDTTDCHITNLKAVAFDMADGFLMRDSVYTFTSQPVVATDVLNVNGGHQACLATVCFPSHRPVIRYQYPASPYPAAEGNQNANEIWHMRLYATCSDGKVTENVLSFRDPLLAGNLKIFKLRMFRDGSVASSSSVGVSVTLDWKPGGTYTPSI